VEPIGAIQALLTGKVGEALVVPTLVALLIAVALVILLGTAFCSWACPIGTFTDSFDKAVEKFLPKIEAKRAKVAYHNRQIRDNTQSAVCKSCLIHKAVNKGAVANGILIGSFAAAPILGFNALCTVCPIGISTRSLFHLKSTTYLTKIINPIFIELLALPVVAVLLSLRERRFFCNKLCPVGALFGGIASLNPFIKPKLKQERCIMKGCPEDCKDNRISYCGACRSEDDRKCEKVCPANINIVDGGSLHRCSKCFECYIACEYDAIKIHAVGKPDIHRVGGFFKNLKMRLRKKPAAPTAVQSASK
jgi:ferredoxin-type protein NapH